MIGPCCTRDSQNGQIFKGADVLPQGKTSHDKSHSNAPRNAR